MKKNIIGGNQKKIMQFEKGRRITKSNGFWLSENDKNISITKIRPLIRGAIIYNKLQ